MPATTGEAEAQAAETTQPQAGTAPTSQAEGAHKAQAAGATSESGTGQSELDVLRRELEDLRKEAAKARTENKRLTDAQKAAEDAKLSETEKLQRDLAAREQRIKDLEALDREREFQRTSETIATKLGYLYPDLASGLIDRTKIDFAEDGRPRNIERLLSELLKDRPKLGRSAPDFGGGNRGGAAPQSTDMNAFIRRAAGREG
jgi:hypothetical protein